ncbi:flavin-containing monooxygenase [Gordonia neofelifaecis]|uniref:FAD dependent oxidoreductase n=1 Tax=Gordonia neofelifaecis NRRL B-59395 TaxID=644548 RepID=F1YKH4_9ACTN|nr:NAD(P)/FAD-dependent oxidoreductase [Gordonia neofelifaecis]EGD54860.1 FAD dependent oxidoreductase [Gordonia neofelifaecis NRRL B-59395]
MTDAQQRGTREEPLDVLIVGAGLSGIDAAYRLRERNPGLDYRILERRSRIGGTWDLFRYPGVRSDSDIFTLSFPWNPWRGERTIAEGDEIREYLEKTARDFGIYDHITFDVDVAGADFDTTTDLWTVDALVEGVPTTVVTRFLYMCTGYYRYEAPYRPDFPGEKDFTGTFVHPQFWPEDLDYAGKNVVVIGSGATAVTLIPSMAPTAGSVTMLQRSPTYMLPYPWEDGMTKLLQRVLPAQWSHNVIRWRNALVTMGVYLYCRTFPKLSRRSMRRIAKAMLPKGFDVDTHFNPKYEPWDQRLCVIPDGDFYRAVKAGTADVVTDTVERITPTGIDLTSGRHLEADIIVTATGLDLVTFGGAALSVDGEHFEAGEKYAYRGYMLNDVPNMAWSVGYTNASWTLRVDLTSQAVGELIRYMRAGGYTRAVPSLHGATPKTHPLLELDSGYVKRAGSRLPKAGDRAPWQVRHNLILDAIDARKYDVTEEMTFA